MHSLSRRLRFSISRYCSNLSKNAAAVKKSHLPSYRGLVALFGCIVIALISAATGWVIDEILSVRCDCVSHSHGLDNEGSSVLVFSWATESALGAVQNTAIEGRRGIVSNLRKPSSTFTKRRSNDEKIHDETRIIEIPVEPPRCNKQYYFIYLLSNYWCKLDI